MHADGASMLQLLAQLTSEQGRNGRRCLQHPVCLHQTAGGWGCMLRREQKKSRKVPGCSKAKVQDKVVNRENNAASTYMPTLSQPMRTNSPEH